MKLLKNKKFWDSLLAAIFTIIAAYFVYRLFSFRFLPDKILYLITFILVLFVLISVLMIFVQVKEWIQWIKRIVIIILCGLLGFAGVTIGHVESSTRKITAKETIGYTNIHVIVKNDSNINKVNQLKDKTVMIQNGNDKTFADYAKKKLKATKGLSDITFETSLDYTHMVQSLLNEECDAIVMTEASYQSLGQAISELPTETKIIQTYKMKKVIKASSTDKDIRYDTFTILITGNEGMGDISSDNNSDVNMLLIVNPLANHVEMISIPRDSFVPNPALGNGNDKLTHTGSYGSENTVKAMEQLFGFDIDFYLKVNFYSVIEIVDAVDGIDMDIPLDFCEQDENRSFAQEDLICLSKGKQHLNGKQALAYARHRHSYTDQDLSRNLAQQAVFKAMIQRLLDLRNVTKIQHLMDIATRLCATNMPIEQVTNFISYQLDHPNKWTFSSISLNNGYSDMLLTASYSSMPLSVYVLNKDDIQAVIDRYYELCNLMKLSKFSFDLDNLDKDRVFVSSKYNFFFAGYDSSAYEAPVEEAPQTPETPLTPEEPQTPETPVDPDEPETPVNPGDGGDSGDSGNTGNEGGEEVIPPTDNGVNP